jgi:nucleotide-binding universal stress UspA family protein
MPANVIVSYDGTHNEDDAVALGRLLARAGAQVSLAYVRHVPVAEGADSNLAHNAAEALLDRGVSLLGVEHAGKHVVTDPSTPEGLRKLAEREGADLIVFCSDSHTATGHIAIGNSAQRLLDGGAVAIAIAPAGLAQRAEESISRVAATDDAADSAARDTAESLAGALGASVTSVADAGTGLLVLGSRAEAEQGHVSISSASERQIENATSPVLVVPRGKSLTFSAHAAVAS